MAKKPRKALGSFGSLSLRDQRFTVAKFDAVMRQARPSLEVAVDDLRKNGQSLRQHVFVIADLHEGSRLLVRDLTGESTRTDRGFVGVIPSAEAARVLRLYEAEAQALQLERPLNNGQMRILFSAEGEVTIIDEDLS